MAAFYPERPSSELSFFASVSIGPSAFLCIESIMAEVKSVLAANWADPVILSFELASSFS